MKKYFEVTNLVGSDRVTAKIVMWFVQLFYTVWCTPNQNFVALRKSGTMRMRDLRDAMDEIDNNCLCMVNCD